MNLKMFDIESKKAVIISNLSKNLWLVALILTFMLAAMSMKFAGIGTAQEENFSDNSTLINETLPLPDVVNDTGIVNETIANETIVNENYTNETLALPDIINDTNSDDVLINDTELPVNKSKLIFSIQGDTLLPLISFTNPTPADGAITTNTSIIVNISIINASDLKEFKWNWNGTNYTFYDNRLVLMMNFDNVSAIGENSTKVVDVSSNSVNGTVFNAVFNATGKYGGAYQFNGVNAWINGTKMATNAVDNWAIAAWIKPASLPQGGSAADLAVYNGNDGNATVGGYGFGIGNGAGLAGSKLQGLFGTVAWIDGGYTFASANTWYYVVMTRVSGTTYFYVNGNQTATSALVPSPPVNVLSIGCQINVSNNPWRYFNGTIDEVRVYNKSLSANEVTQQYYSNLYKYDLDKWAFITNQSNLTSRSSYTYQGCANNTIGSNCTETRSLYAGDWTPPSIGFTNPTPANGTFTANTFAVINISITNAPDLNEFKWNWNSTNYTFYNDSLELMFNFDNVTALGENTTRVVDVSRNGNNGTLYNSPARTTGKYDGAWGFAGTTYAAAGVTGFSASTGAVLMWIKPNKDLRTVTQALFDTYPSGVGALRIYSNNDNTLRYETGGTLTPLAWTIPSNWTGQWHQIGLNWSGSATALIVDGVVVASGGNTQAPVITTFEIGRYNSGSNFNGTIDEVRVYSAKLSPAELGQRYYSNLNKYDIDKWTFITNQSNLTAGTYTYQGFAKDANNNTNKTDLNYLYIDLTAPTINFTSPTELPGSLINTRDNIIVNVTANDTNLANITVYLFNSTRSLLNTTTTATSPNFINFTSLASGLYYFNSTARDAAGNSNSTETRNVTISYDFINPLILVVYPQNTTYSINVSALNYTVSDANLQACWYSINGGQANVTVICGNNVTNLTSTEGSNTWTIWANDTIGNRNSSSVTFGKDTGKPQWSNPLKNATTVYSNDIVKFNATWTNAQLAGYKFAINQTGTWVNSSYIPFTGATNVSENISLIVAPAGTNVTWYFWANDTAGNANQTDLQSFVVQVRNTSLAFSVNQTIYPQGRGPGGEFDVYIPFQARYLDNLGQPISGATCNVVNDKTSDNVALTYNATTGNYTEQVNDYMMYDVVNFTATCSKTNYNSASNSTTTNVWLYYYLWEWQNQSYGTFGNYTATWLRKEIPSGPIYTLTENVSAVIGANIVNEFVFQGLGPNNSMTKNFNFIGTHTARLNMSVNDSQCKPYLCVSYKDIYLNLLAEHCGAEQTISANTPTIIENNLTFNQTFVQGSYFFIKLYLNCSSPVTETVKIYYNYTNEPSNFESHHAEPTAVITSLEAHTQLDANYTVGPNSTQKVYRKTWVSFNNTASNILYVHYFHNPRILVQYTNATMAGTIHIYNSTGQLLASDNVSAGAPETAIYNPSTNQIAWDTEYIPAKTKVNETIVRVESAGLHDTEVLFYNTTSMKQWNITLWSIFTPQIAIYNVTAWTNYSAYGVPNNFGFRVNKTNSSGTFDISSQIFVNTTTKVITMPMTSLTQVVYTVTAGDTTPPTVHLISPANGTVTNQPSRVFSCNITNIEIASLALNIWNSTGDLINTNTTDLSGTFNQTNWTFTLPYDNGFKWNCLGYDTSGNSNWSSEGNYTITLDRVAPTINVLECTPSQTSINGTVVCNATINDATGINSAKANVTLPNTTVIWATVSNLSSNYYFMFNYTGFQGRYNITWFANDSLGNSNTSEGYFIVSSIPSVVIVAPHGEVFGQRDNAPILTNVSDPDGIDTVISQVTLPDGTKVNITLGTGQESDNFDTDSMGVNWEGENSTVNLGQTCIADIDTTASGAAHTSISHCGAPYTDTYCSLLSKKAVAGDFDISVSFNATNFTGSDMAINLVLIEEPASIIGQNQIFMSLGNWTGTGQEYQLYVVATNYSDFVSRRNTNDTSGKFRITRVNNTFTFYTWNNTGSLWFEENMSQHNFSLDKALYITLQSETSTLNWGTASVNWDNLTIASSNYTFGMFPNTNLTGNYNVTIFANDTLGALNNTEKTNFTIEFINSPPSTPFVLYPNANTVINGVKNITWSNVVDKEGDALQFNITLLNTDYSFNSTIASNYGNNQSTRYQWNTALYKDGDYSLKVMVFENASAERLSSSNTLYGNFTIYNTLPAIQFVAPTPASGSAQKTADILINITASDSHLCLIRVYIYNSSHVIISYLDSSISPANFNFSGYADGLYYFNATATDTLSNLNSTETRNVTIDTIPPTITIISPQNATYNNRTQLVNISASDPNLNTTWFFNGTANETYTTSVYRTFAEGSNTIIAYANDSAGNFNSTSITFSIDSIKPSINFTSPTETPSSLINTRNNVLVNVTANDTNLANITVNLYNSTRGLINSSVSSTNPYFVNFSDLANGLYYFNATARDSANNANSTETRNVTIFYDVKFPLISIAYPQNTTYNTNVSALNYTIVEANLDKCWYSTNLGVTNTTITCGNNVTGLTSTEGSNTWAVWINDTVGNTNSSSVTFSKDTIKPLISITYPQNMTYNTDISRLNYTVSDANLQACWYSTNNGQANTTITCGTNVTGLTSTEGSNTWVVWANDTAGNTNSSSVTFSKDTIPPNITSTLISPYDPAVAYNITLNATATDNIGISGIFVNITLPNTTVITRTLPMANYTIQIAGRYNVTFWVNDTAGNVGTSADYFIAGSSRVNVQFNIINNNSAGLPANLTIYFTGTDKTVYGHNFTGIYLDEHTTLLYDLYYQALDGNISVRLNEVNLSLDNNRTIGLDRLTGLTGYLVTYGINNTYSFTNAILTISYAGTGYTDENYLGLYKCSDWNFVTRTCAGTWTSVTGTQDKTAKTFTLTTTGFSAYSIKQEAAPAPPTPEGPGGGAGKGITFYKFNISITGNCTGKDVTLKAINQISNKTNMSGVHVTVTYGSKALVLVTNDDGIATFKPSAAGIYTIEFKKEGYPTITMNYTIYSCIAAEEEKPTGKYIPEISEISEIYEKAKKPVFVTLAIILSILFILFIIIKVFRMRKLEGEFHREFVKIRRWENGIIRENEKED